jgi:hypothetical protein
MTTGRIGQGGSPGAALYHVENIAPRHGIGGELVALAKAAKQRAFLVIADTGRADPGIQVFVQRVMAGHLVALATLFMKPEPGAAALLESNPLPARLPPHSREQSCIPSVQSMRGHERL